LSQAWSSGDHPMPDEAKLREELAALDARRQDLDAGIRDAVDRQRYASNPDDVAAAQADERNRVVEMDRLMTRIRAAEGKLLLLRKAGADASE
jgi:hypothetical protein